MARPFRNDSDGPPEHSSEKESLSERMRELISTATLEERRTSPEDEHSGSSERRRRGDKTSPDRDAD